MKMNEKLINEYINNLATQVNNLTQENILLKTRLAILEREQAERQELEKKEKEQSEFEAFEKYATPDLTTEEEAELQALAEQQPEPEPTPAPEPDIPPLVRGPKPKGYNPKVDGPRPLIPNPKLAQKE